MSDIKSLSASQLAALDFMITRAQERGLSLTDQVYYLAETDTAALGEMRGGLFAMAEQDRRTLEQMGNLARQVKASASLGDLLKVRADLVRSMNRG